MKPYYEADGITIYCADNRDILPLLGEFDLLLTDPPYGISRDGSKRSTGSHGGRKAYEFMGWDSQIPERFIFERLIDKTTNQIIWGGNYFTEYLPPRMKWLVWDKGQRIDQSDGELAWTSLNGALRILTLNRVELMMDGAQHPAQKPEKLMTWCISQVPDAKTILDPWCGRENVPSPGGFFIFHRDLSSMKRCKGSNKMVENEKFPVDTHHAL